MNAPLLPLIDNAVVICDVKIQTNIGKSIF